jgi:hypothetical protein
MARFWTGTKLLKSAVRPHTTLASLALGSGSLAMASRKSLANWRLPGRLVTRWTRQLSGGSGVCPHAISGAANSSHRNLRVSSQQARTLYPKKQSNAPFLPIIGRFRPTSKRKYGSNGICFRIGPPHRNVSGLLFLKRTRFRVVFKEPP